jgi:hypothetical protein
MQQMGDLRALASSDSVDSFVLSYSNILNVNSSITPNLVEKLCACRWVFGGGACGRDSLRQQGAAQGCPAGGCPVAAAAWPLHSGL